MREVLHVERYDRIRFALFRTHAEGIVIRVGRNLSRLTNLNLFSPLPDQIDDFPDQGRTNISPLKNFFLLVQDVFGNQPREIILVGPVEEYIGAQILAWNVRSLKSRDASH